MVAVGGAQRRGERRHPARGVPAHPDTARAAEESASHALISAPCWSRAGGASSYRAGVWLNVIGWRTMGSGLRPDFDDRLEARPRRRTGPRHRSVWIGAHGTPAARSRSNHSREVRDCRRSTSRGMRSARFAVRSWLRVKRGSSTSSGHAEHLAQLAELPVVAGDHDQLPIRGGQRLVGEQARVRVAHPVGDGPAGDVGRGVVHQARQCRAEQADLEALPLAGHLPVAQGGQDPDGGVQAGHHVEHRDPGAVGGPVRIAGQAHQPAHRLDHQVVAGDRRAALSGAEPVDRGVHHRGVGGVHGVVVQSEPPQPAGLEVLDDDIGAGGELLGQPQVLGVAQVQGDGALVAVDAEVVGRHVVADRRHPGAGVVPGWGLHLDDLGPHVGQQHRRVGAGEDAGEVRDQDSIQRPTAGSSGLVSHGMTVERTDVRRNSKSLRGPLRQVPARPRSTEGDPRDSGELRDVGAHRARCLQQQRHVVLDEGLQRGLGGVHRDVDRGDRPARTVAHRRGG